MGRYTNAFMGAFSVLWHDVWDLNICDLLKKCGIQSLIFSGELTDVKRRDVLKKFNSPDNTYAQKYKVLLLVESIKLNNFSLEVVQKIILSLVSFLFHFHPTLELLIR